MLMERRIKLEALNNHIICTICQGYLIDATTVTECLHTFCKSCLVKHLEENNTCPTCQQVIHQSHPLNYISFDRTMQDIVYKLVPELQDNEMKREREFYRKRNLPCPKDVPPNAGDAEEEKPAMDAHAESDYHRQDEQIDILCNDELLGKDHTLKFVFVTRWRSRESPLRLQYRPRIDI
ncbi:unnamed protein product [Timema podura]|uniref:RING-type domain-containing protein n=1 Tax=Timema podura TaxID=61482 RepID=A0ABN7NMH7_TIMPD|nr:unnamed protein product [Timema podura]